MPLVMPSPHVIAADSVPSLRWGVIGTGIAGSFVSAVQTHTTQRIVAVAARDKAKTEAFAATHGLATVHGTTDALITDPGVDVVYIATPHPLHHDLALAAIAAGKHVLIEKPIAMSAEEARVITAAGRTAGVLVMEAMWTRYLPQAGIIRQVLADGGLGQVNLVRADFGFSMPFLPEHRMWNAELGGGALLDAGVYPISFASSVLGPPASITATGALTSTGVDARADLLMVTPHGATAIASTSMVTSMTVTAAILGSAGRLEVLSPFFGPSGITLSSGSLGSEETETWVDEAFSTLHDGLAYQATYFAGYVAEGRAESPLHTHEETGSVMATIDEARRQVAAAGFKQD
jgi:predicted dehydrogenase